MTGLLRCFACVFAMVVGLGAVVLPAASAGDSPFKPFGELTKDAEQQSGFLDIFTKRENIYLEIPVERLGEPMLLVSSISRGIGTHGVLGGMPSTIFDGLMVQFERRGDRIHMVQINHKFRAPEGSPEARAVALSYGNSVLASMKIESERREGDEVGVVPKKPEKKKTEKEEGDPDAESDGDEASAEEEAEEEEEEEKSEEPEKRLVSVMVDFASVLYSDLTNLSQAINDGEGLIVRELGSKYSLDRDRSGLNHIKVFPQNAEFDVDLTFVTGKNPFLETVIDSRYVTVGMHHSFSALPAEPMRPRYADPRLGYFTTVFKDFSRNHEKEFFVRYVNRWRLEKRDPNAKLSRPVKPIVYYVENNVPKEYRKYIKQGIEVWQKAFEAAGFKDAIIAKDQPDDPNWSAEDVRYSTIRWITSHNRSFGAIGPSRTDPRTGEILDADILMEAAMFSGFRRSWQQLVAPKGTAVGMDPFEYALEADRLNYEEAMAKGGPAHAARLCSAGQDLSMMGSLLNMALVARGDIQAGASVPEDYLGQAIVWVTAHEVGHTLGLQHNFKSSMCVPYEKLNDKQYVKQYGLYGSVMEYPTVNISPDPRRQGYYFTPVVGSYDDWVIRYGYSEFNRARTPDDELKQLAQIAGESSDPKHYFGTGIDSYPVGAADAYTNTFDLSDDPLRFARERTTLVGSLFDGLENRLVADGDSWNNLTGGVNVLLFNYYRALGFLPRYVGGMATSRAHRGDPGALPPMMMLEPAKQREAVEFVAANLFTDEPFRDLDRFMTHLEPTRWTHWGVNVLPGGRADFPLYGRIQAMQRPVINRLTHPLVLGRVLDSELYHDNAFTLVELFDTVGNSVWREVAADGRVENISTIRRGGQRLWLDRLIEIAFTPDRGTPDDARSVARMNLTELRDDIDVALDRSASLDGYTKAHLLDCQARIETALDSGYQLEVLKGR